MGGIGVIGKDSNAQKTFMEMGLEKVESIAKNHQYMPQKHIFHTSTMPFCGCARF